MEIVKMKDSDLIADFGDLGESQATLTSAGRYNATYHEFVTATPTYPSNPTNFRANEWAVDKNWFWNSDKNSFEQPCCSTGRGFFATRVTSTQTISNTTATTVGFNSVEDDGGGDFTTGSTDSYFTAPFDGRFLFSGTIRLSVAAAGKIELTIVSSVRSIVAESSINVPSMSIAKPAVAVPLLCEKGEEIRLKVWHNTGSDATVSTSYSQFSGAQCEQI